MTDDHSDKAPDAYRTISEVADDLDLPQHVLRFWETRFSQIKPLKRGGGRRYYRPDDVALITGIRELLYNQGFTIKGVQKILRDNGAKHVQAAGRTARTAADAASDTTSVPTAPVLAAAPAPHMTAENPRAVPSPVSGVLRETLQAAMADLSEARRALQAARAA